jgi:hypothetical protein
MPSFSIEVTHGQVCVFDSKLRHPLNPWGEEQVRQGFSCRPGSVSFLTLQPAGELRVEVERLHQLKLFEPRAYALVFDHGLSGTMWARLCFCPSPKPIEPQILITEAV